MRAIVCCLFYCQSNGTLPATLFPCLHPLEAISCSCRHTSGGLLPSGDDNPNCFLVSIITVQEQMSLAARIKLSSESPRNVRYRSVVWAWPAPRTRASCVLHIWIQVCIPQKTLLRAQGHSQRQALLMPISVYQIWCGRGMTAFHTQFCHGDSTNR